jgi:hypothetical protein
MAETNRVLLIEAFNTVLDVYRGLVTDVPEADRIYPVIIGGFAVLLYGSPHHDTPDVDLTAKGAVVPILISTKEAVPRRIPTFRQNTTDLNKDQRLYSSGRSIGYD